MPTKMQLRSGSSQSLPKSSAEISFTYDQVAKLPAELLLMTFKLLPKKDLKTVRLVSAAWNDLATEFLFDRIWISHRQKDLDVFNEWTANKRCSSVVKTLIYDASFLDPNLDSHEYSSRLCDQLTEIDEEEQGYKSFNPEGRDYKNCDPKIQELFYYIWGGRKLSKRDQKATIKRLFEIGRFEIGCHHWINVKKLPGSRILGFPLVQEGHAEYLKEALLEQEIRDSEDLYVYLTRGLERLPTLQSVTFWDRGHVYEGHVTENFDPLLPRPVYLTGPPFVRSWHPLFCLPDSRLNGFDADPDAYDSLEPTQHAVLHKFETLLGAISLSLAKIPRLDVRGDQIHLGPMQSQLKRDCPLARKFKSVFANLEFFRMTTLMTELGEESDRFLGLQDSLSTSTNLTYLNLQGCQSVEDALQAECVFASVLPCKVTLGKLRTLKLRKLAFEAKNLVSFLRRHKLSKLELDRTILRIMHPKAIEDIRTVCNAVTAVPSFKLHKLGGFTVNPDEEDGQFMSLEFGGADTTPVVKACPLDEGINFLCGLFEGEIVDIGVLDCVENSTVQAPSVRAQIPKLEAIVP